MPLTSPAPPRPAPDAAVAGAILVTRWWNRRGKSGERPKRRAYDGPRHNPTLKELLNSISSDVQLLASQTLALARLEIPTAHRLEARVATVGALVGVLVALAGGAVLVSALVLILIAFGLPAWAAATLIGVGLIGAGPIGARYFVGGIRSAEPGMEERESLRATMEWLT